jgi:hypothetical protein
MTRFGLAFALAVVLVGAVSACSSSAVPQPSRAATPTAVADSIACALLDTADADLLLGGQGKRSMNVTDACTWVLPIGGGQQRVFFIQIDRSPDARTDMAQILAMKPAPGLEVSHPAIADGATIDFQDDTAEGIAYSGQLSCHVSLLGVPAASMNSAVRRAEIERGLVSQIKRCLAKTA